MPELPEVETMRRGILEIVGGTVERAFRYPCRKRPIEIQPRIDRLQRKLLGLQITDVQRLGKRVVLVFDSGHRLVIEPRMTGLVLLANAPTEEHLRFGLELSGSPASRLIFWDRRGLGRVTLLTAAEYQTLASGGSLGPDALAVSAEQLRQQFAQSGREIKVALLDQKRLLGVGNLYASEILHLAQVHPGTRCDRISRPRWEAIHACLREVLLQAIEFEGSTLSDGTYRNALNAVGGYQNHHRVYDREGEPCPRCPGARIVRIVQAQRSTFFCKKCQTRR